LSGGDEGLRLIAEADARMTAMLAPGLSLAARRD